MTQAPAGNDGGFSVSGAPCLFPAQPQEDDMSLSQAASQAAPSLAGPHDPFASLMEITSRPPVVFVEGRGSWLRDQGGRQYLDFIQGWAVNCLGHCHDAITNAIAAQAGRLLN